MKRGSSVEICGISCWPYSPLALHGVSNGYTVLINAAASRWLAWLYPAAGVNGCSNLPPGISIVS